MGRRKQLDKHVTYCDYTGLPLAPKHPRYFIELASSSGKITKVGTYLSWECALSHIAHMVQSEQLSTEQGRLAQERLFAAAHRDVSHAPDVNSLTHFGGSVSADTWIAQCMQRKDAVTAVLLRPDASIEEVQLQPEAILDWQTCPHGSHRRSIVNTLSRVNGIACNDVNVQTFQPSKRLRLPKTQTLTVIYLNNSELQSNSPAQSYFKAQCRGTVLVFAHSDEGVMNYTAAQFQEHWIVKPRKSKSAGDSAADAQTPSEYDANATKVREKLDDIGRILAHEQQQALFQPQDKHQTVRAPTVKRQKTMHTASR